MTRSRTETSLLDKGKLESLRLTSCMSIINFSRYIGVGSKSSRREAWNSYYLLLTGRWHPTWEVIHKIASRLHIAVNDLTSRPITYRGDVKLVPWQNRLEEGRTIDYRAR